MPHTLRLYGNLVSREWRLDQEPAPELSPAGDYPWVLLAELDVPDGTALDHLPQRD